MSRWESWALKERSAKRPDVVPKQNSKNNSNGWRRPKNRAPQVGGRECPRGGLYPNLKRMKISRAVDTALPRKTIKKTKENKRKKGTQ
eukprot:5846792-Prymnesium_polylepis.1